ncbi:hypothetical protein A3K86_12090 [Photobacterium jeanii]|uniref:Golvesin/Xly CBD-like domain-containing protein n=1 Tax=Photobacterium jeanii TaxID=858640 RepID=A0A178KAF5_9GAMM|nr:hypothetical protein [Photobacterium jeanii]OAN14311.1 hypothetical protein A3K86_12090 [Photobacterium jeanii]PST89832.1 hypothetical protein C9I91_12710 [Photobacterium jeanii]
MILTLSASVTGCFDDSSSDSSEAGSYHAGMRPHVVFAPQSQQMDLVNDLRFGSRFAAGVNVHTADDGVVSINGKRGLTLADSEGFSTTAQFDVAFSQPLDPASVSFTGPNQNVFVLPLQSNGDDPVSLASFQGNGSKLVDRSKLAQQQFRANVVVLDGEASVLRISPLAPLAPQTKYLVILTNTLRDTQGQVIVPADEYHLYRQTDALTANLPLGGVVSRWHNMASDALVAIAGGFAEKGQTSYLSQDRQAASQQIAHAFTFTTTMGTAALEALASPKAALINQGLTPQQADDILASVAHGNAMPQPREVGIIRRDLSIGDMLDPFLQKLGVVFNSLDSRALAQQFDMSVAQIDQLKAQYQDFKLDGQLLDDLLSDGVQGFSFASFGYPKVKFVQGHITLPYYLAAPELDENRHIKASALAEFGNDEWQYSAQNLAATSTNAKTAFPYPEQQAQYKVPFLVTLPQGEKPDGGWPVVIFQHGILGDRSNSFPAGMALASLCDKERPDNDCFATIAIDLPLHGISPQLLVGSAALPSPFVGFGMDSLRVETKTALAALDSKPSLTDSEAQQHAKLTAQLNEMEGIVERHFSATRSPTGEIQPMSWDLATLNGSSGSTFMNFSNVLSQRDRMRQAISDLLNLNASLKNIDLDDDGVSDFDISRVYFVGHSLGGVLGMPFVAVNNDPLVHQYNPNLPKIQAAALLTTGGGVPKLLEHSPSFRPEILGALKHLDTHQPLTVGSKAFEHYFYTLQSVIDGVDPLNFAAKLKASDTGLYMAEVVGGAPVLDANGYQQYSADGQAMTTLPDQTIPNSADGLPTAPFKGSIAAPLAGTEPMVKLMGLKSLQYDLDDAAAGAVNRGFTVNAEQGYPLKVVARFNRGTHVSPVMALENIQRMMVDNQKLVAAFKSGEMGKDHLSLIYLAADSLKRSGGLFLEMTGQVSDFFTHNGTQVSVKDANFLSHNDSHQNTVPLPALTLVSKQPQQCEAESVCIIDNGNAAFETQGVWSTKSDRPSDSQGTTYAYAAGSGDNYFAHAAWWFRVNKPGTYRVSMRTPSNFAQGSMFFAHGATTGARYNVFAASGESSDRMFNLVDGVSNAAPFDYPMAANGEYMTLGEFVFDKHHDYKVTVHNRSVEIITGPLIADAIKVEFVSSNTNMSAAAQLTTVVEQVEALLASAQVGNQPGQYPQAKIDQLKAALASINHVSIDPTLASSDMLLLKAQLDKAVSELEKSQVPQPVVVTTDPKGTVMDNSDRNFKVSVAGTIKVEGNGQYGRDYYYSTDANAVAEWTFEVAESGNYQITFNSPGGFGSSHGYGSDKTMYRVLRGESELASQNVDLYNKAFDFAPLVESLYLEQGTQYKVRISGAYSSWSDYGIVADAIQVTHKP